MNETPKPDDFDKNLDLHESEWSKAGKKDPVLGRNGVFFCILAPLILVAAYAIKASFLWALASFGFGPGLALASAFWFFFIWLALDRVLSVGFDLADFLLEKMRRR